ncbi:hypothetical protein F5B19DRAFT_498707 [Rostrohypoxylon terebratum]|nr:hypothetical protein F5B19DRAFT_498707 [Rostrohypoxylon terebratum]
MAHPHHMFANINNTTPAVNLPIQLAGTVPPPVPSQPLTNPSSLILAHLGSSGPRYLPTQPHQIPNPYISTATANDVVVCVVCGNICRPNVRTAIDASPRIHYHWTEPVLIKAKPGFFEWCKEPFTSGAYRRNDIGHFNIIHVEQFIGGSAGFFNRSRGQMAINSLDEEMYLPIHMPCLELALAFCRYQSRFDINFRDNTHKKGLGEPSSLAHLYEIWTKRAWMTEAPYRGLLRVPILDPRRYLGAYTCRDLIGFSRARNSEEWQRVIQLQESDPSADPFATARAVMARAEKLKVSDLDDSKVPDELIELRARLTTMPPEIRNLVEDAMEPFDDLSIMEFTCTRVYCPEWWRDKLIQGHLIPWLHDLTIDSIQAALREKHGADLNIDLVDWEKLCRLLAQPNPFDTDTGVLRCPRLHNRRRIWKLLSGSRLGHVMIRNS